MTTLFYHSVKFFCTFVQLKSTREATVLNAEYIVVPYLVLEETINA